MLQVLKVKLDYRLNKSRAFLFIQKNLSAIN